MENDLTIYDVVNINEVPTNKHAFLTALADILKGEGSEAVELITIEAV